MKSVGVTCLRMVVPAGKSLSLPFAFAETSRQLPIAASGAHAGEGPLVNASAVLTPVTTANPAEYRNHCIVRLQIERRQRPTGPPHSSTRTDARRHGQRRSCHRPEGHADLRMLTQE